MLRSMAASSGYMAVLVLALYVNSGDVLALYVIPARYGRCARCCCSGSAAC